MAKNHWRDSRLLQRAPPQFRHTRWNVVVVTRRGRGIFMGPQNSMCTQDAHRPTGETSCGVIKVGIPRRKRVLPGYPIYTTYPYKITQRTGSIRAVRVIERDDEEVSYSCASLQSIRWTNTPSVAQSSYLIALYYYTFILYASSRSAIWTTQRVGTKKEGTNGPLSIIYTTYK